MKQSDDKGTQGLPQSTKDQDKQRDAGKIRQISDKVEVTKVAKSELHRNMPDA